MKANKKSHGLHDKAVCVHCGSTYSPKSEESKFCCSGCEYVYRLIHDENLDRYYELRDQAGQPVGSRVFSTRDLKWLEDCFQAVESGNAKNGKIVLSLQGISCVGCVWLIDKLFSEYEGGDSCLIDVQRGMITIQWRRGGFDLLDFVRKLRKFGYEVGPYANDARSETTTIVWRLALCGAFALNSMLFTLPQYLGMKTDFAFANHFSWLSAFFATASMLFGGGYFLTKAFQALKRGYAHMDLPISIGLVAAYLVSWIGFAKGDDSLLYFDFVSTFVFLMLVGRWIHVYAIERNRGRLADIEIKPSSLERINEDGEIEVIGAESLKKGDQYRIGVGEWAPVESELLSESATVGLDWINGESGSIVFVAGGVVPSGAINHGSEPLLFRAGEEWVDSLLYRLLGARYDSGKEDFVTQKWIARYLISVIAVSVVGAVFWALYGDVHDSLRVFVSTLVVSCPCALGIALPLIDELSHSMLKRNGVFLNTNSIWNKILKVKQIVFDKTGTLTSSSLEFVNSEMVDSLSTEELIALSALVSTSGHPVASSMRETLLAKGLYRREGSWSVEETVGLGVSARMDGKLWRLGRSEWAGGQASDSTTLTVDGKVVAEFMFSNEPWADAASEIDAIEQMRIRVQVLSGDAQAKVDLAAASLGLPKHKALGGLLPQEKEDWLRANDSEHSLMVGDGANDSLAFDVALVAGTPAVEKTVLSSKADFYYLGTGIQGVRYLLDVAKGRKRGVVYLLSFALLYNVVIVGAALSNVITPVLAAVFMPLSSLVSLGIVWLNALRQERTPRNAP